MLVDINVGNINIVYDSLMTEWPQSIHAVNFLRTCYDWKQKDNTFEVSLLCSESKANTGLFIGVLYSGCHLPIITLYVLKSYETILQEELLKWSFEWNNNVRFEQILPRHKAVIDYVAAVKGLQLINKACVTVKIMDMPIEIAINLETECLEDITFGPLSYKDLEEIYKTWVLNDVYTIDILKKWKELDSKHAVGIFDKNSGVLLSRCLRTHAGLIAALQTAESVRGKGYAKLLIKYISKSLGEASIRPYTFVADFNDVSLKVFHSVGYFDVCDLFVLHYQ